ncbi:MAG: hypothetical protein M3547_09250, partial [Acidobacteriota bacterium]|nr:hypothetical protein [Acidobacteriota bacterium]
DTRLLIQANSGGGKSWCLRRILEQTHGQVQHLVIDPEGEFPSLREKFDYVLAAKTGGDTAADPRSAKLLAERLLELGVSAVLDIYELKAHDRIRFVRLFLEALVDAPKKLWHPAIVVVDEAHVYCPQQGEAESAGAVIDLATRGRKRGFCAVLATQRLSKLHKDAAAECNNKLIGRTGLDVDVKRAADELGLGKDRWRELRDLEAGHFFAFGPAISREVVSVHVGAVQTTHPKAGARLAAIAPAPTAKVKALLPKLADLPAEAEARQKTVAELQTRIRELEKNLLASKKTTDRLGNAPEKMKVERVEVPVLKDAQIARLSRWAVRLTAEAERHGKALSMFWGNFGEIGTALESALKAIAAGNAAPRPLAPVTTIQRQHAPGLPARVPGSTGVPRIKTPASPPAGGNGKSLGTGERKILRAIAQHPDGVTCEQLTVLTGYKRSSRDTYVQRIRSAGLVVLIDDSIVATSDGVAELGDFTPLPTGDQLRKHWLEKLPKGEKEILEALCQSYPGSVDRERLSELSGKKRSSRDTYIQRLRSRKLVEVTGRGELRASEQLFS